MSFVLLFEFVLERPVAILMSVRMTRDYVSTAINTTQSTRQKLGRIGFMTYSGHDLAVYNPSSPRLRVS